MVNNKIKGVLSYIQSISDLKEREGKGQEAQLSGQSHSLFAWFQKTLKVIM